MKKNSFYLAAGLMGLLLTTAVVSSVTSAAPNRDFGSFDREAFRNMSVEERQEMRAEYWADREANHEAVETAIENNDYNAWADAVGDKPMAENVTAENFPRLVEAHNLMEEARTIFEELGIEKPGQGNGHPGMHKGFGKDLKPGPQN